MLRNDKYDYIIYELSSYMLETLKPKLFIGILGNIYPCHIDWHNDSMAVYAKAKTNLLVNSENIIINQNFTKYLDKDFINKNIKTF
ncbi:MAG: Mur ligase family protein [Bacteroidota bacterium]|nr:Mur ligase family protein [Bacteroidota bacterium]